MSSNRKITPKQLRRLLKKELKSYLGAKALNVVADKAGVTHESVRLFFDKPERTSETIEKAAFDVLEQCQLDIEEKAKRINAA